MSTTSHDLDSLPAGTHITACIPDGNTVFWTVLRKNSTGIWVYHLLWAALGPRRYTATSDILAISLDSPETIWSYS